MNLEICMRNIAMTGAGGYLGQSLIEDLNNKEWCSKIYGVDIHEPSIKTEKLHFEKKDIRDKDLESIWENKKIDTLVHLAFVVNPTHDDKEMYDVNVNGTLNVIKVCKRLGIKHLIIASSGTAYGAWPDNPYPIQETDPIRLFPKKFSYAHHKGIVEKHISEFIKTNPDILVNVVRPSIVYGPNTENYLSRFLKTLPFVPLISGNDPDMQFVHERDVADCFSLLIQKRVPGSFNLAGDGVLRFSQVAKMARKKSYYIPTFLIEKVIGLLWAFHLVVEAPPGIIDYLKYQWVLDTTRAKENLGWKPKYTTKETLQIMLDNHGF